MNKDIMNLPTLKEIELDLFRVLQNTFSDALTQILEELDQAIASSRDTKRFYLKDKRKISLETMFGTISLRRNYYRDCQKNEYVCLLDRYLAFEGTQGVSPLVENLAMELAVTGSSYRHASSTLEQFLGYHVMSHETIRQRLLETEVSFKKEMRPGRRVLFVEVDGLYVKRQQEKRKGKEEKIASVHEGWNKNGKRTTLIAKRHYIHRGEEPFWEGFEQFLMDNYHYDPMHHLLIINGDGAEWITACRDHFKTNAFYCMDRFHVARDIRSLFKGHPRYREIRKKLANFDAEGLLMELNSAVGTLDDPKKEEQLEKLINQLSQYPEALSDYRKWLQEKGIDTTGMRPMGSAEATMSVFAKRVKNGRAWVEQGIRAFLDVMIGLKDNLQIKTLSETIQEKSKDTHQPKPTFYKEKITNAAGEATRNNIPYFQGTKRKPVYHALKSLQGI